MTDQSPYRLIIHKPDADEYFILPSGTTTMGRESSRELVLKHPMVSRLHAQITCTPSSCEITDLESANGTVINDQPLSPHVPYSLKPQDRIQIGPFEMILESVPGEAGAGVEIKPPAVTAIPIADLSPSITKDSPRQPVAYPVGIPSANGVPASQPPGQIPPSFPPTQDGVLSEGEQISKEVGSKIYSTRLINFLPDIYRNSSPDKFMERFLGLFESIWLPIEYNVDNFDLYLDPRTAPTDFLPWLAQWFDISIDFNLNEAKIRAFLYEAPQIYACRGTRKALIRVLEIFTGCTPDIIEFGENLAPHTFMVHLNLPKSSLNQPSIERLIELNKPAHTTYRLEFGP
jgi:phage tail-like protein